MPKTLKVTITEETTFLMQADSISFTDADETTISSEYLMQSMIEAGKRVRQGGKRII
jgi:hypothetical protein